MLIDCFIFYNELDILEYRLNILYDVVDYFVLVEATNTFVGEKKPLFYEINKKRFEKFNNKIIHIVVDDMPIKNKLKINKSIWDNEKHQRNCIVRGLNKIKPTDESIIIISDVDEIPDPRLLKQYLPRIDTIYNIVLDLYWYNLNRRNLNIRQNVVRIGKYRDMKNRSIQYIRNHKCKSILNRSSGWHLSYFGDVEFIHNKLSNFAHQEPEVQSINTKEEILKRMHNGNDLYSRNRGFIFPFIHAKDNHYLPPQYEKFLSKYITK